MCTLDKTSMAKMVDKSKLKNFEQVYVPGDDIKDNKTGWTKTMVKL